jgi:hypothetical protein
LRTGSQFFGYSLDGGCHGPARLNRLRDLR